MANKMTTGEVIKELRSLKLWTQKELAKRTGIAEQNICSLENDKFEIGKKRAEQIAKAFEVPPSIIMFPEYGYWEFTTEGFIKNFGGRRGL